MFVRQRGQKAPSPSEVNCFAFKALNHLEIECAATRGLQKAPANAGMLRVGASQENLIPQCYVSVFALFRRQILAGAARSFV
jgi:hypothetical protein